MNVTNDRYDRIPDELRGRDQWVGFTVEGENKTPVIAANTQRKASSTAPETWGPFNTAMDGLRGGHFNAIAYALNGDFIGVDLDDCFDANGNLSDFAAEIVSRCESYTEVSFSGTGLHILLRGKMPGGKGRKLPGVEIYGTSRFFICTGTQLPNTPDGIASNPSAIQWLLRDNVSETAEIAETIEDIPLPPLSAVSANSAVSVTYTVDELIRMTCPQRQGERNERLFDFARGLRFNCEMAASPLSDLKPLVKLWYNAALPFIRTKDFTTTWTDFVHAWPLARLPLGADALTTAWERSRATSLPAITAAYDSESVRQLMGLCAALGSLSPNGRFYLSCHSAAQLMNMKPMSVHRWLKMLIADGVLEFVNPGNEYRATRYRWTGAPL